jgi:hypothetical protein
MEDAMRATLEVSAFIAAFFLGTWPCPTLDSLSGDGAERFVCKAEMDAVRLEQPMILFDQRGPLPGSASWAGSLLRW